MIDTAAYNELLHRYATEATADRIKHRGRGWRVSDFESRSIVPTVFKTKRAALEYAERNARGQLERAKLERFVGGERQ